MTQKLEALELENAALKRSIYELSMFHSTVGRGVATGLPVALDLTRPGVDVRDFGQSSTAIHGVVPAVFHHKTDLQGHQGSVYCVNFSRCGNFIASGSFDATVRVWDLRRHHPQATVIPAHSMLVSAIAWGPNPTVLYSTAFDKTVRLWSVQVASTPSRTSSPVLDQPPPVSLTAPNDNSSQCVMRWNLEGFGLSVACSPTDVEGRLVLVSESTGFVRMFDARAGDECAMKFRNSTGGAHEADPEMPSQVNSLHWSSDGNHITLGDHAGRVRTLDARKLTNEAVHEMVVGAGKPVSHVGVSGESEDGHYMCVNSYDDVLYIYACDKSRHDAPALMHTLRGHRNRNWPIQSSIFQGRLYRRTAEGAGLWGNALLDGRDVASCLLVATGSADNEARIFDITGPEKSGVLHQRLQGHKDRVYCAVFHHTDPLLATCSADSVIKIWTPKHKSMLI
eukprot:c32918_g1_i1.p1 GENE.c32918_g1_i1~~c32918_g1_i1.p1  ORF type:complete len:473 (+),score=61.65 c32918_g1_i1:69-1421(+)